MNFDEARNYWINVDSTKMKMNEEELKRVIEEFIKKHKTCALATGFDTFIRCTPIEYTYKDGIFYLVSEGGMKFYGIERNKNVCLAIYEEYDTFANCHGLQVSGTIEVIEQYSNEYNEVFAYKHIPIEAVKKMNHPMHLLKITPQEFNILSSDFKRNGLDTYRQKLIVK